MQMLTGRCPAVGGSVTVAGCYGGTMTPMDLLDPMIIHGLQLLKVRDQ